MSGVNKVIILGRLGKDPESRNVNSNTVANFSVATSESYKDKTTGEKKETTEWHNCVAWGSLGDIAAKYLHKGDQVYIEGKLKTRSWEKDGVTRYVTEILVNNISLLGGNKPQTGTQSNQNTSTAPSSHSQDSDMDSLPF